MNSTFKVGDKVISPRYGEGIVIGEGEEEDTYSITIQFSRCMSCFTKDGYWYTEDYSPSLFHLKGYVPAQAPEPNRLRKLKVDTKVLVWTNGCARKYKRYFAYTATNGDIACFKHGRTSWNASQGDGMVTIWDNWELAEDAPQEDKCPK